MRFGQSIHCLHNPLWAQSYFEYNAYKRQVKAALRYGSEAENEFKSKRQLTLAIR